MSAFTQRQVFMSSPDLTSAELQSVTQVLSTRHLSIGPQIDAFESTFAAYVGTPHAAAVNSGTSALHLAIIAAGVKDGDYVLTTPFSFIASANCILYERAIPIFVDVDPATGNIDPALVAAGVDALQRGAASANRYLPPALRGRHAPTTAALKALLPVHAFGQPADMDPINAAARPHGLPVIEDACEAVGAEYYTRKAGTLGDAAVFAFYPNKQMTTGEGGMIVTARSDWNEQYRSLRNQGRSSREGWLDHTRLGYNYRLDEMSAALGLSQLGRIDELLAKRARVAEWYDTYLQNHELIETPFIAPATTRMSWFVYVVRIRQPLERNKIMAGLDARGIPSRPYFTPIHLQPFYVEKFGYQRGDFPVTESLGDACLALPFSSVMSEEDVAYVAESLADIAQSHYVHR